MMLKVIDVLAQSGNRCPGTYHIIFSYFNKLREKYKLKKLLDTSRVPVPNLTFHYDMMRR